MTRGRSLRADLPRLKRLRHLRLEVAQRELEARRADVQARQASIAQLEARIGALRNDRSALFRWASGPGATDVARVATLLRARRAVLDEDIERTEAVLADERVELAQAEKALEAARAAWLRERRRCDAVDRLVRDAERAHARRTEVRAERELDAAVAAGAGR